MLIPAIMILWFAIGIAFMQSIMISNEEMVTTKTIPKFLLGAVGGVITALVYWIDYHKNKG